MYTFYSIKPFTQKTNLMLECLLVQRMCTIALKKNITSTFVRPPPQLLDRTTTTPVNDHQLLQQASGQAGESILHITITLVKKLSQMIEEHNQLFACAENNKQEIPEIMDMELELQRRLEDHFQDEKPVRYACHLRGDSHP